jgi:hypothetical protein
MTMKCALSHNFPPIRSGERGLPLLVRATLPCGRSCWGLLGILPEWRLLFRVASAPPPRISRGSALAMKRPGGTFPVYGGEALRRLRYNCPWNTLTTRRRTAPALLGGRVRNRANVDGGHRVLYNPRPSEPCDSRSLKVHHDFEF